MEHCREWVKAGAEVTVITCQPNFPKGEIFAGYRNRLLQRERLEGIEVIRVWSYIAANEGFAKRTLDFISYAFMAFWTGLFVKADVIIATSPQFFTTVAGGFLGKLKRRPWIMEVRDLWPESIKAVGALSGDSFAYRMLERLELWLYDQAASIVVVTDAFKANLTHRGVNSAKIHVVKNGVDLDSYRPRPKDQALLDELNLNGKFVIGYIGTHGMAHALDFILRAAANLSEQNLHILLLGNGAEKQHLLALHQRLQLTNVTMLPFVAKSEVARYISILDVALVNLKKSDTFKTVIPSKIFENAALRKPILLGVAGESKAIIEQFYAGIAFEPENEAEFLACSHQLYHDREGYRALQQGCEQLALAFDRKELARRMLRLVRQTAGQSVAEALH